MTPIYYIKSGNLNFAEKIILKDVEIYLYPGDKICLIGRNGCGKSSLLKIIIGDYELDKGELFQSPKTTIDYLTQDINTNLNQTIYDFILSQFIDAATNKYQADIILEKLGLDGDINLSNASGGQLRRAYLAKVLVMQPDILLLDEPTNHLDIATIEWLEEYVKNYQGAIICISHDRAFLSNVTNKIWWLDRGKLRTSDKGFKYFDQWQEIITEQEEASLKKLNKKLDVENSWLSTGVTARRKRNQKRLHDLKALRVFSKEQNTKLSSAQNRIQAIGIKEVAKTKFIIEAEGIYFTYNNKSLINNFTFRVKKGEKIGLIGPNGSGKSTLIKLLTKDLKPNTGYIKHGTNLEISYFDQHKSELDANQSIAQTICPNGNDQIFLSDGKTMHIAGYLKKFMFDPKTLSNKVSTLSGGEASRLLLAKTLINPGNLLILDEPTNDLDMDSLEILLEILSDYPGTLLIVSHDRDFLDRLVSRTLVFTQDKIIDFIGGYEDYRKSVLNQPKEYKKITSHEQTSKKSSQIDDKSTKLTYKDQRLLETAPDQISKLEAEIKKIELKLSDSNLYFNKPELFQKLTKELEAKKAETDFLLTEWLRISG